MNAFLYESAKVSLPVLIIALSILLIKPLTLVAGEKGPKVYPKMEFEVTLDKDARTVSGLAHFTIPRNTYAVIELGNLKIGGIQPVGLKKGLSKNLLEIETGDDDVKGSISFSVSPPAADRAMFHKDPTLSGSYVDSTGAALFGNWLPLIKGLAYYSLKAKVPEGWLAISEADEITKNETGGIVSWSFVFPHPRQEVSLIAGPYVLTSVKDRGVKIEAYFFPEDEDLSQGYLKKAKKFLDMYSKMIGPYPFKRFAVVENRLPTGYGFATFTLLGQKVARLPFIVDTSLGHEILHSWFGNSVYIGEGGNWSEGLTTYLADHLYEEKKGKGPEYRHNALMEYQSYIPAEAPLSLKEFSYRADRQAKAVGYIKGFMLFHMLRQLLGEEDFYNGLRSFYEENKFKPATFDDLRSAFQKAAHQDLKWFFDQWLQRRDIPVIEATSYDMRPTGQGKWRVTLEIEQVQEQPYRLNLPVKIETENGVFNRTLSVNGKHAKAEWKVDFQPKKMAIDPDYHTMRHLDYREFPPVLHRLFGANEKYMLAPAEIEHSFFLKTLTAKGFVPADEAVFKDEDKAKGSYLILGSLPEGLETIAKELPKHVDGVLIKLFANPYDTENVIAVFLYSSPEELDAITSKIFHYGKYSLVHFKNGHAVQKRTAIHDWGIEITLARNPTWMAAPSLSSFDSLISQLKDKRVIFVGEKHDEYSHHLTQKRIIEMLTESGVPIAVGMEMFQRPFQRFLDSFVTGEIDEDEMLRKTEYFKRWGYDYHLYSPIIRYCRDKKIPIVALNLRSEISKKVARQGVDALTEDEKKQLPASIDWTKDEYRQVLRDIYFQHGNSMTNFDHFYQAQVLWDETMAESISTYIKENPERHMVVIAGSGHILYRLGIPSRAERRGVVPQAVVALSADQYEANEKMADLFVFPGHIQAPFSAKLGVYLDETDEGLVVKQVSPGSPADKGGVKKGDLLLEFDSRKVPDITELKLALLKKDEGDYAILKVKRSRKLLPDKEVEIKVGPFRPIVFSPHSFSPHQAKTETTEKEEEERSEEQP